MRIALLLVGVLTLEASAQSVAVRDLVEAERAFAAHAAAHGTRAAFLAHFAEDAILFRPDPVNALAYLRGQPDRPGLLSWYPIFAEVAASGDLGYTTGPSTFKQDPASDRVDYYGYFVSVWKRQADGAWKVLLDVGTSHPGPEPPEQAVRYGPLAQNADPADTPVDTAGFRQSLLDVEVALSEAAERGSMVAYVVRAAPDVRVYRNGRLPLVGRDAVLTYLAARDEVITWTQLDAGVARSGDLGYTYGSYSLTANDLASAEEGHYVHVWRKLPGGPWSLVLDIIDPRAP